MAGSLGRITITLDRDVVESFHHTERPIDGIIDLDLPNPLRTIPGVNRLLAAFFVSTTRASSLNTRWWSLPSKT